MIQRMSKLRISFFLIVSLAAAVFAVSLSAVGAEETSPRTGPEAPPAAPTKTHWYEKLSLRGYTQVRYNRLFESNERLLCEQCDRSLGTGNGFFLRRARLVVSGDVHERVYIYIQNDFAASASTDSLHFAQLRDAYFDLAVDREKEFRFRIGISKVPFGFENLQSSSNRLALDRADPMNAAVANERDIGVFFLWAPAEIRKRFQSLANATLKGTGDYGVVAFGVYNGQTLNRPELNDNRHIVARVAYPFELSGGQIIEPALQAYTGLYSTSASQRTAGVTGGTTLRDERVAASFVLYPQPFGFQIEGTVGRGPEYSAETNTIELRNLAGGYAQVMYRTTWIEGQSLIPYLRAQYYDGGKKIETDARRHLVREYEFGAEWAPIPALELTAAYSYGDRLTSDGSRRNSDEHGQRLRFQAQFNY
jgi:hypothetical protein